MPFYFLQMRSWSIERMDKWMNSPQRTRRPLESGLECVGFRVEVFCGFFAGGWGTELIDSIVRSILLLHSTRCSACFRMSASLSCSPRLPSRFPAEYAGRDTFLLPVLRISCWETFFGCSITLWNLLVAFRRLIPHRWINRCLINRIRVFIWLYRRFWTRDGTEPSRSWSSPVYENQLLCTNSMRGIYRWTRCQFIHV